MWARHGELMLGLWLAVSPFVFRHPDERTALWANDLACAAVVVALALLAHARRLRRIHLLQLPVAGWLVAAGWWQARAAGIHADPAHQNWILTGLVLAMFAIVPSHASRPPDPWQQRSETR